MADVVVDPAKVRKVAVVVRGAARKEVTDTTKNEAKDAGQKPVIVFVKNGTMKATKAVGAHVGAYRSSTWKLVVKAIVIVEMV
jgi:hypothetical protein